MTNDLPNPIIQSIVFLAGLSPDGAALKNDMGFNGADAFQGLIFAKVPAYLWTPSMLFTGYRMIQKYHRQLAEIGINPADIEKPEQPSQDEAKRSLQDAKRLTAPRTCIYSPLGLFMRWERFDPDSLSRFKQLFSKSEIKWEPAPLKQWMVIIRSMDTISKLQKFCTDERFEVSEGAAVFMQLKVEAFTKDPSSQEATPEDEVRNVQRRMIPGAQPKEVDVHFDYSDYAFDNLLSEIKSMPYRRYAKEPSRWIVSMNDEDSFAELKDYAEKWGFAVDPTIFKAYEESKAIAQANIELASAMTSDWRIEGLLREPRPYQWHGAHFGFTNKRYINGDDPGTGKTIMSIVSVQAANAYPVICIVPKLVLYNWRNEWNMTIPNLKIAVLDVSKPDSPDWMHCDVFIINYDMLARKVNRSTDKTWSDVLQMRQWSAIICDEAHALKSSSIARSKAVKALVKNIEYRFLLTGTPILNRPSEITNLLSILGRLESDFGGWKAFTARYCSGATVRLKKGRTITKNDGAHNLFELNEKLKASGCFLRRTIEMVLPELPDKQYTTVYVPIDNEHDYRKAEADIVKFVSEYVLRDEEFKKSIEHLPEEEQAKLKKERANDAAIKAERGRILVMMGTLRKLVAKGKMSAIKEWLKDFDENEQKLVFFGWHREVVEGLARTFEGMEITGDTPAEVRTQHVYDFQNDPEKRMIFLNMQAGGVGITLTAACNCAFAELPWTPALVDQAVARLHRFGQKNAVNAWFLMTEGTIDEDIFHMITEKRAIFDAAMDGKESEDEQVFKSLDEVMKSMLDRTINVPQPQLI